MCSFLCCAQIAGGASSWQVSTSVVSIAFLFAYIRVSSFSENRISSTTQRLSKQQQSPASQKSFFNPLINYNLTAFSMKFSATIAAAVLAFTATAAPAVDYSNLDYSGVDFKNIQYPDGTGENLPYYPPPPGGWESVDYPAGTGVAGCPPSGPFTFTSTYHVMAKGSEVVNASSLPAPGPAEAVGFFEYGINSFTDTICYNITLLNVVGAYQSPARTATHIHEAAKGKNGPPRVAFPNPVGDDKYRNSIGCLRGPFVTGVTNPTTGKDQGDGFTLKQIEANPAGFFTDSHTALFVPGVVRGQLA